MKPRTPIEGAFGLDWPCPDCGQQSLLGFLYLNQHGAHMHTHYVCTYWMSEEDPSVYMDPDHDSTVNRCGWHGWVVPEPRPYPPSMRGSVVEATNTWNTKPRIWLNRGDDEWVANDCVWDYGHNLKVVRVLFDAGAEA